MGNEQNVIAGEVSLNAADFIHEPSSLRAYLNERGALRFTPYPTGLFPASYLSDEDGKATKMDMAWIRDNAHALRALLEDGQIELARGIGLAFLQALENNRQLVDDVNDGLTDKRFPVRFDGVTLENDDEDRIQNDSVGYLLWGVAPLLDRGIILPDERIMENINQLVKYVSTIRYWDDYDQGHWEEDFRLHGTSIGPIMAGLRDTRQMLRSVGVKPEVNIGKLLYLGNRTLRKLSDDGLSDYSRTYDSKYWTGQAYPDGIDLDDEAKLFFDDFSVHRRRIDAAEMFLVTPLNVITGDRAFRIVTDIEKHLNRERGHARYVGDTYWMPDMENLMSAEERTHQAEGRLEWRNQFAAGVAYLKAEAQWTLNDSLAAKFWGESYMQSGDERELDNFLYHFNRALGQFVECPDGTLGQPENFYYRIIDGKRVLVTNHHTPLLWPRANFLYALRTFEKIFEKTS